MTRISRPVLAAIFTGSALVGAVIGFILLGAAGAAIGLVLGLGIAPWLARLARSPERAEMAISIFLATGSVAGIVWLVVSFRDILA